MKSGKFMARRLVTERIFSLVSVGNQIFLFHNFNTATHGAH
jgi:hypothetical protein